MNSYSLFIPQECVICLSSYEDGSDLRELPCQHNFHCACIDKWLHLNATCPLCKYNILKGSQSCEEVQIGHFLVAPDQIASVIPCFTLSLCASYIFILEFCTRQQILLLKLLHCKMRSVVRCKISCFASERCTWFCKF